MVSTMTTVRAGSALAGLVLGVPTVLPAWVWAAAALAASPFPRARVRADRAGRRLALLERARVARLLGAVPGTEPARGRFAPYLLARSAVGALVAAVLAVFALGCVAAGQSLLRGPGPAPGPGPAGPVEADWYDPLVTVGALLLALALGAIALLWAARTEHELTVWAFSRPRAEVLGARVRELARTRSEVLEAVADERRRIERDLHDGLQQRLLSLGMLLGGGLHTGDGDHARDLFLRAHEESARALAELRDVAWRIHPVPMTPAQAQQALETGLDIISGEIRRGLDILLVGEMGIGNTTSASAIIAALTGQPAAAVTGRGTGVDDAALAHKIAVIEQALALHAPAEIDTLAKVGGLEIGVMAGLMLGAAAARVPVVIDGLISTAAALIAQQLDPQVTQYLIAGHRSAEPGHSAALSRLELTPVLDLGMRLGEGTGAALALPVIEAAMRTLQEMATFDSAGVSSSDVG